MRDYYIGGGNGTTPCANHQQRKNGMKCTAQKDAMTLNEAKEELEKFVQLKTTMRPTFVDVLLNAGRWIPVTERLPEEKINPNTLDFEEVLCSTTFGDVRAYKFGTPYGWEKPHFWLGGKAMDEYVLAWMPMPEPYVEE